MAQMAIIEAVTTLAESATGNWLKASPTAIAPWLDDKWKNFNG
jgi:hypothetical protein